MKINTKLNGNAAQMAEAISTNFSEILRDGGDPATYFRAVRFCARLAAMTGQTTTEVIDMIVGR